VIFGEMFNATSLHQEAVGYGGYKMLGNKHIEVHIYADVCRIFARNDDYYYYYYYYAVDDAR